VLYIGRRGGGRHQRANQARRESHSSSGHVGSRILEGAEGAGVVGDFDADFVQQGVGVALDQGESLLGEDLEGSERPP
jgi:hypothetical protein